MEYRDGTDVQLGDRVEVDDAPDDFESEEATVINLGKSKIRVEYAAESIKTRKAWVKPGDCELIARES